MNKKDQEFFQKLDKLMKEYNAEIQECGETPYTYIIIDGYHKADTYKINDSRVDIENLAKGITNEI